MTRRCLESWAPPRVIQTTEESLGKFKVGGRMKFRNNSLLYNISNGKIYLIVKEKRFLITDPDYLVSIGSHQFSRDIMTVSLNEINTHEYGGELPSGSNTVPTS